MLSLPRTAIKPPPNSIRIRSGTTNGCEKVTNFVNIHYYYYTYKSNFLLSVSYHTPIRKRPRILLNHPFFLLMCILNIEKKKKRAIPTTDHGDLWGCEMLRIPHCLDSRFTDGSKAVSPTHQPCSTLQKRYFSASGTHFT
jgi:hypothetical protein